MTIAELCWPMAELGRAASALMDDDAEPVASPAVPELLSEWMNWVGVRAHAEVTAVDVALRDVEDLLRTARPAIYELSAGYLVVLRAGKRLSVLAPDLTTHTIEASEVAAQIRAPFQASERAGYERILNDIGFSEAKKRKTLSALLNEHSGARRFRRGWYFTRIRDKERLWSGVPQLLASHTVQYLVWLGSWALLGSMTFSGHMDRGWLVAWALMLMTLVPLRLATIWWQGKYAIGLGRMLKRRLFRGALRLTPEEVRTGGVGSFLGQALEAEAVETLAISGGIAGLLALVELIPSMFVLGRFAIALALWCGVALALSIQFFRRYRSWTGQRMELTNHLVETMVGHRTRLAQAKGAEWHGTEDASLAQYRTVSENVDTTGAWLVAMIPRGWLLVGLACLAPSLVAGKTASSETAILLGGVLLAFSAFQRLVAALVEIGGATTAWQRVKPLFEAADRKENAGSAPPMKKEMRKGQRVLEAERLNFRYSGQAAPALQNCSLLVRRGEKILLEGPSGGGKTTLASVLTGLRKSDSGLLLINGNDRHTLGEAGWRKQIAAAPQFHENHIVSETLAFNLLMGRAWPATESDLQEAATVCEELGLGDLLARMPSGLMQRVGEGGWQLSHGERSRVFLARALLQKAEVVILDESFAALDPENLQTAMETTMRRAETLMVIAHP